MIQFVLYLTQDQMERLNNDAIASASPTVQEYVVGRLGLGAAQTSPAQRVAIPADLETKVTVSATDAAAETEVVSEQPGVARRRARG